MAKIIDFFTRSEIFDIGKIVGLSRIDRQGVHVAKDGSKAQCPYCRRLVDLPGPLTASFTCRNGEHFHMFTKQRLEVSK